MRESRGIVRKLYVAWVVGLLLWKPCAWGQGEGFVIERGILVSYEGTSASVVVPGGVVAIGAGVFRDNLSVQSVSLPSGVISVGAGAFRGCSGLRSVTVGEQLEAIGDSAFMGCGSLTSLSLPGSLRGIGKRAFEGSGLTSVTFASGLGRLSVGEYAFNGCVGLSEFVLPARSGATIGGHAFGGCTRLATIVVGSGLDSIGSGAFTGCSALGSIDCGLMYSSEGLLMPPPQLASDALSGVNVQTVILYVPGGFAESEGLYRSAPGWKDFAHIQRGNIRAEWITVAEQTYIGSPVTPTVTIFDGYHTLQQNTDYSIAFANNTDAGTATLTVKCESANYGSGSLDMPFVIRPKSIRSSVPSSLRDTAFVYNGEAHTLDSAERVKITDPARNVVLKADTDYILTYANNINVSDSSVNGDSGALIAVGTGNYTDTMVCKTFMIRPRTLEGTFIERFVDSKAYYLYSGRAIQPGLVVTDGNRQLTLGVDYFAYYSNDTAVTLSARLDSVRGIGNYRGIVRTAAFINSTREAFVFTIAPDTIRSSWIRPIDDQEWTGGRIIPGVVVVNPLGDTLRQGSGADYIVTYGENIVGQGSVTVSGVGYDTIDKRWGNYAGQDVSASFRIVSKLLDNVNVPASAIITYGDPLPDIVLTDGKDTLEAGKDYTIVFGSREAGLSVAQITGQGDYGGKITFDSLIILPKPLTTAEVGPDGDTLKHWNVTLAPIPPQSYTGNAIQPDIVLTDGGHTLEVGEDYTIAYERNVSVGTATLHLTGIGNYAGTATDSFTIIKAAIHPSWVHSTTIEDRLYVGEAVEPGLYIVTGEGRRLRAGSDYTVDYVHNDGVGTGLVRITAPDSSSYVVAGGGIELPFQIVPNPLPRDTATENVYWYDTVTVYFDDTAHVLVYDTLEAGYDTVQIVLYDTVGLPIYDTIYDTIECRVVDSVYQIEEVEVIEWVYVVLDNGTGVKQAVTAIAHAVSQGGDVTLLGLAAGKPFAVYNVGGGECCRGVAPLSGVCVLRALPQGLYILEQEGRYSKFVHRY